MGFKMSSLSTKKTRNENLGHIALEVDTFDTEKNAFSGVNIETGEAMTVRMATRDEFAGFYVSRNKFDTEDKRKTDAARQMRKQPSAASMADKVEVGSVLQMQSVFKLENGDHIARWVKSVTTSPENQAAMTAMVEINKPYDDDETKPVRKATAVLVDETFTPEGQGARENLDNLLTNNGEGRLPFDFAANTGVLVAFSNDEETQGYRLMTGYQEVGEGEEKKYEPILGLEENITRQPYDVRDAIAQTTLAAVTDVPFEDLQAPSKTDDYDPDALRGLYDAVKAGELEVSAAPVVQGRLMPFVTDDVVASESAEKMNKGASLSQRGFFPAHFSLQLGDTKPESNERYATSFRDILQKEKWLRPTTDDKFTPVYSGEVAGRIADRAGQIREREAALLVEQNKTANTEKDQSFGASMSM